LTKLAERAGINSATLHHYFPTKEALVEGVAAHLEQLYVRVGAPERKADRTVPAALRDLRQEFADAAFFWREHPTTWAVHREFVLRAPRDQVVADIITRLNERWCAGVERILAAGRDSGVFRADLDPAAAALAVVGAQWGALLLARPTEERFAAVCQEIEKGLTH
jgi:AcrR family transcriptional regulator